MHILIVGYSGEALNLHRCLTWLDVNLRGTRYTVHVVWNEPATPLPKLMMHNHTLKLYSLNQFIPQRYRTSHPRTYTGADPNKPGYWRQQVIKLVFPEPTRWCIDTKNTLYAPVDLRRWDGFHPLRPVETPWISTAQEYGKLDDLYISHTPFLIENTVYNTADIMDTVESHLAKHHGGFSEFVYYTATTHRRPSHSHAHPIPFTLGASSAVHPFQPSPGQLASPPTAIHPWRDR